MKQIQVILLAQDNGHSYNQTYFPSTMPLLSKSNKLYNVLIIND